MRVLRVLGIGVLPLGAVLALAYLMTAPSGPARLSTSHDRLRSGPHEVGHADRTLVDASRPTPPNGDFAGAGSRTLETTIWFPESSNEAHPLLIYSHGFMSMRREATRYAEHLASHGMVVIASDYPLTSFFAPGGPNLADAPNQPGDVSFLIDSALRFSDAERPFPGSIDSARIGAAGLSLGGFTTTLAAFHPTLRDPRISVAVSIAGPSAPFAPRFFGHATVPFLMIGGDADAIVDYAANAAPIPAKLVHGGGLLTLVGGTHTGFAALSHGVMRVLGNPDRLGCWALSHTLKLEPDANPFAKLGGEEQGLVPQAQPPLPCANGAAQEALAPGRQLMITTLALRAFLEAVWAQDAAERDAAARFLEETLAADFPEAHYQRVAALPPRRELVMPGAPYHPGAPDAEPVEAPAPSFVDPLEGRSAPRAKFQIAP